MAYGLADLVQQRRLIDMSEASEEFKRVSTAKLDALLGLCETAGCRRVRLLDYFGEASAPCGNCDTCLDPPQTWDATEAARKALLRAGGLVLHPIMMTEVVVPDSDVGTVMGDLQSRRAVIRDTTTLGEMTVIHCDCALDRLLGYITDLRGMTRGRGQFTMTFDRFDAV